MAAPSNIAVDRAGGAVVRECISILSGVIARIELPPPICIHFVVCSIDAVSKKATNPGRMPLELYNRGVASSYQDPKTVTQAFA